MVNKMKLDVVGDPIEHSKSPLIHEPVLLELAPDYTYRKRLVKKGELRDYLEEVKREGINGFNLTMPHKQDILPYLDFIDDEAKLFNAVNTVKVKEGKLFGYNTDGRGLVRAMEDMGYAAQGKNIAILGAGGVASTAALKFTQEGASRVTIFNRSLSSAEEIAKNVFDRTGKKPYIYPFDYSTLRSTLVDCDILVNCTPLGMDGVGFDFEDLSFLSVLKSEVLVYDLIYNPSQTSLLKEAKKLKLATLNGLGMLIYQGLFSEEIFWEHPINLSYFKSKIELNIKNLKNF